MVGLAAPGVAVLVQLGPLFLAQAPAERVHVDWLLPDGCPDRPALAERVTEMIPRSRHFHGTVRVDEPRKPGESWRAVVQTRLLAQPERVRAVEGPDCARVTEAALLVLALAATRRPAAPEGEEGTPGATSMDGELPPKEHGASEGDPEHPPPFKLDLSVHAWLAASLGVMPLPGGGLGASVAVRRGPVRAELGFLQWLDGQPQDATRGVQLSLTSVKVSACWLFALPLKLELGPCLGAEGGPLTGRAVGVADARSGTVFWIAPLVGTLLGVVVTPGVRVLVFPELGLNAVRPTFLLDTAESQLTAFRMGLPVGRLSVGLELSPR